MSTIYECKQCLCDSSSIKVHSKIGHFFLFKVISSQLIYQINLKRYYYFITNAIYMVNAAAGGGDSVVTSHSQQYTNTRI